MSELKKKSMDEKVEDQAKEMKKAFDATLSPMQEMLEKQAETIEALSGKIEQSEKSQNVTSVLIGGETKAVKDLKEKETSDLFLKSLFNGDKMTLKKLSEGVDAEGGYTVPAPLAQELVELADEFGTIAPLVNTVQMGSKTLDVTELVKTGTTITWEGEYVSATDTDVDFAQIILTAYKMRAKTVITSEVIEDSIFDVTSVVKRVLAEKLAAAIDSVVTQGTGTGQPTGLFVDTTVIAAKTTGAVDYDQLVDIVAEIPAHRRGGAKWLINSQEMVTITKIKDTAGTPIFRQGMNSETPSMLLGFPIVESDKVTAGSVMFGNYKEAYWLGYRAGLIVETERDYDKDASNVYIRRRVAGNVVLPEMVHLHTLV